MVKKASVDPVFRELLVQKRAEAAKEIDLDLTQAEQLMLSSIPEEQLRKIIANTKVKPEHRDLFSSTAGKLMLAAAAGVVIGSVMCPLQVATAGISPDRIREMQMKHAADANDMNEPNLADPDSDASEADGAGERK